MLPIGTRPLAVQPVLHAKAEPPFPNPAKRGQTVRWPSATGPISLHDLQGRLAARLNQSPDGFVLPASIPPGMYLLKSSTMQARLVVE